MIKLRKKWLTLTPVLRWTLIIFFCFLLVGAYLFWQYQKPLSAALYGHNHTDRPIFSYWVNDKWGGNAAANGGGGVVCCSRIEGRTLKVVWVLSRTRDQIDQGGERERYELDIANPPKNAEDYYLHVHFFPENQVRLAWSPSHDTPYEDLDRAPDIGEEEI
tara:strand:+ start:1031 stop:1513 length:483 start_codon:yes stop_codon:yes gene_type:complete